MDLRSSLNFYLSEEILFVQRFLDKVPESMLENSNQTICLGLRAFRCLKLIASPGYKKYKYNTFTVHNEDFFTMEYSGKKEKAKSFFIKKEATQYFKKFT
jgi:hypothetical protein